MWERVLLEGEKAEAGRGQALPSGSTTTKTGTSMQTRAQKYHITKLTIKLCLLSHPLGLHFCDLFLLFQINVSCSFSPDFICVKIALATE